MHTHATCAGALQQQCLQLDATAVREAAADWITASRAARRLSPEGLGVPEPFCSVLTATALAIGVSACVTLPRSTAAAAVLLASDAKPAAISAAGSAAGGGAVMSPDVFDGALLCLVHCIYDEARGLMEVGAATGDGRGCGVSGTGTQTKAEGGEGQQDEEELVAADGGVRSALQRGADGCSTKPPGR